MPRLLCLLLLAQAAWTQYPNRWVFVMLNLRSDAQVEAIRNIAGGSCEACKRRHMTMAAGSGPQRARQTNTWWTETIPDRGSMVPRDLRIVC
jgi:hypothetical protein